MMARLKNSTSKTNRIFFIFSPIVYDFKNVLVLMFFIVINTVAFRHQCCCAINQCWNCTSPHSGLWKSRRYNINYRMSRKKVMPFLCHLQLQHWMGWFPCLIYRCFKSGNSHKSLQNFFQAVILPDKDNFARSGMKTWIKLSLENTFFLVLKFFYFIKFKFVHIYRIVHSNYDCTENICFSRVLPIKSDYKLFWQKI